MASRYRNYKAVGQEDRNACWAASLCWWLKATNKKRIEQWEIMDDEEYSDLWDVSGSEGTISEDGILKIVKDGRWEMDHYKVDSGVNFTASLLDSFLAFGPVYIGYTDIVNGGHHVNVIYDMYGDWAYPQVCAMEPGSKKKADGTFVGRHVERGLNYYRSGAVILASPKNKISLDR